jgi:HEAT repeat protein
MIRILPPSTVNGVPVPFMATYDELCENLKTSGPLAWASFIALSLLGTDLSILKLIELSQSSDWRFRRSAIEAMAYLPQVEKAIGSIHRALEDSSNYVIRAALQLIARKRIQSLHDDVVDLLKSSAPNIRVEAIATLSEIWRIEDFEIVYSIFLSEKNEKIRIASAWILRAHVSENNWYRLFDIWWQDPYNHSRTWACELASTFGIKGVEKQLLTLTSDEDGHVRKAACKALEIVQT